MNKILPLTMSLVVSSAVNAQEEDVFELSLDELLSIDVEVEVASSKAESIIDTPAIVSRYDTADMQKLGLHTLKDILSFFPGFVVQDGKNTSMVMVRGISESFNQKVLFLLDGIPYWMPAHGDIPLLGIPIESIERVEVIRGPGAVIYGTNASAGVISVVTKKDDAKVIAFKLNNNPLFNASGYIGHQVNEDISYSLSFELQADDGYEANFRNTPGGPAPRGFPDGPNDATIDKQEDIKSILLTANIYDFNILAQSYTSDTNGIIRFDTALSLGDIEYIGELFHIDYNIQSGDLDVQLFADYNKFYFDSPAPNSNTFGTVSRLSFADDGDNNTRTRFGVRANWKWSENIGLLFGAETEERATGDFRITAVPSGELEFLNLEANENDELSAYGQVDYAAGDWRILIGGRYTDNDQSGDDITPRFSVVKTINENSSLKLLRSTGFNSPNLVQTGINLPGTVISDPDIIAETITSTELAYSYKKGNLLLVGNLFYTELEDLIGRESTGNGNETQLTNSDTVSERYGVELDSQFVVDRWKVYANLSYLKQGNEDLSAEGDGFAFFSPKFTFYSGVSYQIDTKQSFGGSARYIGKRNDFDAVFILNANYTYRSEKHEIYATVANITSEDIISADAGRRVLSEIPSADADANVTLGYRYKF